eukprot:TRINITY_DN9632_c0_g1_i1.p1 TRINITY_DN9632_c0_g1~~TRINITY_DN9632_c0_g1_i1.p1  ORF type:complete len:227 (+),score=30.26 TRINITY_DN9632_c0_g1_i1:52-732(+)
MSLQRHKLLCGKEDKITYDEIPESYSFLGSKNRFVTCDELHCSNCALRHFQCFCVLFYKGLWMYTPLNILPGLLMKRQKLFKNKATFRKFYIKSLNNSLRSAGFLSIYVTIFASTICLLRNMLKQDHWIFSNIGGFICAWSILLEHRARRPELVIYCIPRTIEIIWQGVKKRDILKPIKYFEVAIFCLAMGIMMSFYQFNNLKVQNKLTNTIIKLLFGKKNKLILY